MELILISDSKLKIALSVADMERYSLDCGTLDYDCTETRAAFWQLLDEAKHQTGFDAASEKLFVQIYASAGGGCEMYITKLKRHCDLELDSDELMSDGGTLTLCERDTEQTQRLIYHTVSLDDMIGICSTLCRFVPDGESSVYADGGESGGYYIVFTVDLISESGIDIPLSAYLEEYGTPCPESIIYYITEHCRCICEESAASLLGALA